VILLTHKLNLEKDGDSMANFPRIKWLNVDGQQVPFTEPQHFTGNGDETVRTGKDNPLPVANYTQDENGIWLPVSKDNPVPTQVTGSNVEQKVFDGLELSEGSTSDRVYFDYDVASDFRELIFVVRTDNHEPFSVDVLWDVRERGFYASFRTYDRYDITGNVFISEPIKLKTIIPSVRINNNGSDRVFDLHILWRR